MCLSYTVEQDKQCTYNVTLQRVRVTILQWKNINAFRVIVLRVTVNYKKVLSVAQQCFYSKFMSLATVQIICVSF
jgi:hypothetical protein